MVRAERQDIPTEPAMMKPNCLKKVPEVPDMKVTGMNTAINTNVVEITAAVTSFSAAVVAEAADLYFPVSIFAITSSTTTMASSTTVPMANTNANSVNKLSENPIAFTMLNAPINETMMDTEGTNVALKS